MGGQNLPCLAGESMKAILTTIVAAWILVITLLGPMAQQVADAANDHALVVETRQQPLQRNERS